MPTNQPFLDGLGVRSFASEIETSSFDCHEQIVWFLRNAASPFIQKRLSSVVCWMDGANVAGYITTSMSIVELLDGDQRSGRDLTVPVLSTGYQLKRIPALLIGMLGVSAQYEGRGLGKAMVRHAIGQAEALSADTGCRFVTVDADLNDRAIGMYTALSFEAVKKKGDRKRLEMFYDLGPAAP